MAVIARYGDDVSWLTDPTTGLMANSTGTPTWIMPIEIYQAADIGPNVWPVFPGLPKNYSAADVSPWPAWPAWAKGWVASKNKTRLVVPPGSALEAERVAKLANGLRWDSAEAKREARLRMGLDAAALEVNKDMKAQLEGAEQLEGLEAIEPGSAEAEEVVHSGGFNVSAAALAPTAEELSGNRTSVVVNHAVSPLPLHIVPNRAVEAMGYLTAIIDHYDNLPGTFSNPSVQ